MADPHVRWAVLLLLCATGLFSCGDDESTGSDPKKSRSDVKQASTGPLIIFLGDSITAGEHLSKAEAFPAIIEKRLRADGHEFRLVNSGVSGDTAAGGVRRLDWMLKQKPQILVVELGANDGLRGISIESVESNLRQLLKRTLAAGVQPLLLGMRLPPNYGPEYTETFAAVYARLAKDLKVPFIPYFMKGVAGIPDLNLPDGIHPTAAGHEKLADNVLPKLKELLGALSQRNR